MITIAHKIDGNGRHYSTVTNPDYRTYGFETAAYADGTRKPNYPVPAIRNRSNVEWFWIAFKDYHDGNISDYGLSVMLASVLYCASIEVV